MLFAGKTGENPVLTRNRKSTKPSVYKGFRPDESECLHKSVTPKQTVVVYGWSRVSTFLPVYRTRIAHTERVAMSTKTKEVRRFALLIAAITSISLSLAGCSSPAEVLDKNPATSKFVLNAFHDGQFLDPFEDGKADMGLTLEGITSLSTLGYSQADLEKPINWVKSNTSILGSPGLKANYVFTSYVAGFSEDPSVVAQLQIMKDAIAADGTVKDTNNYSYGYIVFALLASGKTDLANQVALKMISNAEVSGGYKYTRGDTQSFESADVTSMSLMAIQATLGLGSEEDETAKKFSIEKSRDWLLNNLVSGEHYFAWDNYDLAGTSFGTMALISTNQDATKPQAWLASRINQKDSGIPSPFSGEVSDVFTTVQALLPLSGITFADVLDKVKADSAS